MKFKKRKEKGKTNVQMSKKRKKKKKKEVLVGHCLRETQVVGIQEAESYLMAQRLGCGGVGRFLFTK